MTERGRLDVAMVSLDGSPLTDDLQAALLAVRVDESVQLPDAFSVRFDDPHFELFDRALITMGATVELAFRAEGDPVVVTTGEVTAIAVEQGTTGRHELVVSGYDATHRLHRGPRTTTYVQMTDADVAERIAAAHGLRADVDATEEVHAHLLQSNQSDFSFLAGRARRVGYDVWVRGDTLLFKRAPTADAAPPTLTWGDNLHRFRVRFSSTERCDEVFVQTFDPVTKRSVLGRASEGDPGTNAPGAQAIHDEARAAFGALQRRTAQLPAATQSEADAVAQSLLLLASGGEVIAKGEAKGDPLLGAGGRARLQHVGDRLTGTYTLTSVEHVWDRGAPYLTRFACGGKEPGALTDLLGTGHGANGNGWGSLVLATVTNVDDDLNLGRVKVTFVDLDAESTWAAVAAPGAGKDRGLQCLPEVGDTVVVGFEHDSHERPIVLGGLWSQDDAPPDQAAATGGAIATRTWRSREGHQVELRDADPQGLVLEVGDGSAGVRIEPRKIRLDSETVEIVATQSLKLSGATVEIEADGNLKLDGAMVRINS